MNCFVIMPYGKRKDAKGKLTNFDDVYERIIERAVDDAGLSCTRCDRVDESGVIHARMFEQIYHSQVAVADITSLNPNVFYELGIRHALVDRLTVLIQRKGTSIPFNIAQLHVVEYDPTSTAGERAGRAKITRVIKNGLARPKIDSPVHHFLPLKVAEDPHPLSKTEVFRYRLPAGDGREIRLVTGDIMGVRGVDIWVSSENTNMQMSRYFERSISGNVRYHGAKRKGGKIIEDTIARALAKEVEKLDDVDPGDVVPTTAGELEKTHGVKRIFHAAAVYGQPGKGFSPIAHVAACVQNALRLADSERMAEVKLRSILFPLLGTGQGRGDLQEQAPLLINEAIQYLRTHPNGRMKEVYFLNWTDKQHQVCKAVMADHGLKRFRG
jgi:O-acetyl-ADP-ribose deacetylase (regulator of RNase III)